LWSWLALIVDAVQRNDMAAFDQLVDTDKIVEGLAPQLLDQAAALSPIGLSPSQRKQLDPLLKNALPKMKQTAHDEVTKQVKELSPKAQGYPFPVVALGAAYSVTVKQQGDKATATVDVKGQPVELTMQQNGPQWKVVGVKSDALTSAIINSVISRGLPSILGIR
jgi:hypothetical protein